MIQSLVKTRDKLRKNKKGFTLIELLVVIAILAILAAILIPLVSGYINNARTQSANADAHTVFTAAAAIVAQNTALTASTNVYAGVGATAGSGQIDDAALKSFLGTHSNFKINKIDTDSSGNIAGVQVYEVDSSGNTTATGNYGTVS